MYLIGSYGAYQTYYDAPINNLPHSLAGCRVVDVKDGGTILKVQPMIQGGDARLQRNHGDPINIPAGDFILMPQLAPICAGADIH